MSASKPAAAESASDAERAMLRNSVRDLLTRRWPAATAVENAGNAEAIAALWRDMAGQGLASLGADPAEAGLREILLVFEELGRASCPAPLLGAVAANLALASQRRRPCARMLEDLHQGKATVALALGAFDGDPAAGRGGVAWRHADRQDLRSSKARRPRRICWSSPAAGAAIVASDAPA